MLATRCSRVEQIAKKNSHLCNTALRKHPTTLKFGARGCHRQASGNLDDDCFFRKHRYPRHARLSTLQAHAGKHLPWLLRNASATKLVRPTQCAVNMKGEDDKGKTKRRGRKGSRRRAESVGGGRGGGGTGAKRAGRGRAEPAGGETPRF